MDDFTTVEAYLRNVIFRESEDKTDKKIIELLSRIKTEAVARKDQAEAKQVWCYEQILAIQEKYLSAFRLLKSDSYYDAWCILERIEIELHHLERHYNSNAELDEYKLHFIAKHTKQYQSMFPYKLFFSPGMLYLEKRCSICCKPIALRNPCGHKVGEIYDGVMCCREVTEAKLLEISTVEKPFQKYSVAFMRNPKTGNTIDQYDYSLIKYLIQGLRKPFDAWEAQWTKSRHPHSRYKHVGRNEDCPCESDKKYKNCCLRESGVLRPHCEIIFSVPPPKSLPSIQYV